MFCYEHCYKNLITESREIGLQSLTEEALGFLGIGITLECFQTCGGHLHIIDEFSSLVIDGAIS